MLKFQSIQKFFSLDLPSNWQHEYEDNIYTFYNIEELDGVIQISPYYSKETSYQFTPEAELSKEKSNHASAQLVPLSNYLAIHYAILNEQSNILSYYWIVGKGRIKLFCSVIIGANQTDEYLDEAYAKGLNILETLDISSGDIVPD